MKKLGILCVMTLTAILLALLFSDFLPMPESIGQRIALVVAVFGGMGLYWRRKFKPGQ